MSKRNRSQHRLEIDEGRLVEPGAITPYRCKHNHLTLVIGPHVFCRCENRRAHGLGVWQMGRDHCPCPATRGVTGYHEHPDGTNGSADSVAKRLFCACGEDFIKQAKFTREQLRVAATAYILAGYAAACDTLEPNSGCQPPHGDGVFDHGLPFNFPAGR